MKLKGLPDRTTFRALIPRKALLGFYVCEILASLTLSVWKITEGDLLVGIFALLVALQGVVLATEPHPLDVHHVQNLNPPDQEE